METKTEVITEEKVLKDYVYELSATLERLTNLSQLPFNEWAEVKESIKALHWYCIDEQGNQYIKGYLEGAKQIKSIYNL